jgi:proteasome regulatory subunit
MNLADEVAFEELAADTDGFTGAELASLCTEAGMFAVRDDRTEVRTADFEEALEKIAENAGDGDAPNFYVY